MNALFYKILYFLGLALVSFLPVFFVAYTANHSVAQASSISVAFAYAGLFFSIGYLGQRAYLSLHASGKECFVEHAVFRVANVITVSALLVLTSFIVGLPLYIIVVAISIKLSEAILDLRAGYTTKIFGSKFAAKEVFYGASIRAAMFGALFFWAPVVDSVNFALYLIVGVGLFLIFVFFFVGMQPLKNKMESYTYSLYRAQFTLCLGFGLSVASSAVMTAAPRLFLVGGNESYVESIALSVAPVLGLVFQVIWLSNIGKLASMHAKNIFLFLAEVMFVLLLIFITQPLWNVVLVYVYGESVGASVDAFSYILLASSLFFSVMATLNILKIKNPLYEVFAHIAGLSCYMISFLFVSLPVGHSLILSSLVMFCCLSFFLLRDVRFRTNDNG